LRRRRTHQEGTSNDLSSSLITIPHPNDAASEAYRRLRTSLLYSRMDDPPKVVLLTSPGRREGKTTTCANLGVVLAQADKETLIVDCDLRKPNLHRVFGLRNVWGLASVLQDERSLREACIEPLPKLKIITAGPSPPNPAEVLGSQRFATFLAEARKGFEYVLVDSPPVQAVSDPVILAAQADGVVLIVDAQATRRAYLQHAMRSLEDVGSVVLGVVVNNAEENTELRDLASGSYDSYPYE
jgi:capsular exopolysaccharide synthesis family protein